MGELEITWGRVLKVWWLIVWRYTIGGLILTIVGGLIAGSVMALIGSSFSNAPRQLAGALGGISIVISSLIWSVFVVRMALRKSYSEFRLALLAKPSH